MHGPLRYSSGAAFATTAIILLLAATFASPAGSAQDVITVSIGHGVPVIEGKAQNIRGNQPVPVAANEVLQTIAFPVRLSQPYLTNVEVTVAFTGYGEFPALGHDAPARTWRQTVTIPDGETEATAHFEVFAGYCPEADETLEGYIESASTGVLVNSARGRSTIIDDDNNDASFAPGTPASFTFDTDSPGEFWVSAIDGDMPNIHGQSWSPLGDPTTKPHQNRQRLNFLTGDGVPDWLEVQDMGNGSLRLKNDLTVATGGTYFLNVTLTNTWHYSVPHPPEAAGQGVNCGEGIVLSRETRQFRIDRDNVNAGPTWDDVDTNFLGGSVNELETPEMQPFRFTVGAVDFEGTDVTYSQISGPSVLIEPWGDTRYANVTWNMPTEPEGPGSFAFTFRATDEDGAYADHDVTVHVREVNRAPVQAAHADQSTPEMEVFTYTPASPGATDPDIPANMLFWSLVSGPSGSSVDAATGTVTWNGPGEADDRPAPYQFLLRVTDDGTPPLSHDQPLNVYVVEVNRPPSMSPITDQVVDEGSRVEVDAEATDPDIVNGAADELTYSVCSPHQLPSGGDWGINAATGEFYWNTLEADGPGNYTVTICATDGESTPVSASFVIEVIESNTAPVWSDHQDRTIPEEVLADFTINATDPDDPPSFVTLTKLSGPAGLSFSQEGSGRGRVQWTPTETDDPGPYDLVLRASDGVETSTVTVRLTVQDVNVAPDVNPIGVLSAEQEGQLVTFDADAVEDDVTNGVPDSYTFSLSSAAPPGSSIHPVTGQFSWTPSEDQEGIWDFHVIATDTHDAFDAEPVRIIVDEVDTTPSLDCPASLSRDEMLPFSLLVTATDPDTTGGSPQGLTISMVGSLPPGASWTPDNAARQGTFSWTPGEGDDGSYTLHFRVTDDAGLQQNCFTALTINEVNRLPTLLVNGQPSDASFAVDERDTMTVLLTSSDGDLVGGSPQDLTWTLVNGPGNATLTPTPADPDNRTFTFTPSEAQGGPTTYRVNVTVSDGVATVQRQLVISVNEVPDPPLMDAIASQVVAEGDSAAPVFINGYDQDIPSDPLTLSVTGLRSGMVFLNNGDGTGWIWWNNTGEDDNGEHMFTAAVSDDDGSATRSFWINVTELNAPPHFLNDPSSWGGNYPENEPVGPFTATAADPENDPLTFCLEAVPGGDPVPAGASIHPTTGVFTWTPSEAQGPGTYTFNVCVTDSFGLKDAVAVTFVIDEVQSPPVIDDLEDQSVSECSTVTADANATDPDLPAQTLVFSLGSGSAGTIDPATGFWSWTPCEADNGVHTITVIVGDGSMPTNLTDSTSFQVDVGEANLPPNFPPGLDGGSFTTDEHATWTLDAEATDDDLPAQTLTYSKVSGPAGLTIGSSSGFISWTPGETHGGSPHAVTVKVTDGLDEVTATFTVTVVETNEVPTLTATPATGTADEHQPVTFTVTGSDADLPTQSLTYSLGGNPPPSMSINAGTGAITWTPGESEGGNTYSFSVTIADDWSPTPASATQALTWAVREANGLPVWNSTHGTPGGDESSPEETLLSLDLGATDTDEVGGSPQTLTFSLAAAGSPALPCLPACFNTGTGAFSWTPTESQEGNYRVTETVSDGVGSVARTFWINITEVHTQPVVSLTGPGSIDEHTTLTLSPTVADDDVRGGVAESHVWSLSQAPAGATIDSATGEITWVTNDSHGNNGPYVFTAVATDGTGRSGSDSVAVTVTETNEVPILAVPNAVIDEGDFYQAQAVATDGDTDPADTLSFALVGAPAGLQIGPNNGTLWWQTDEADDGIYHFNVSVNDTKTTVLDAVTLTVRELGGAPRFVDLPDSPLTFPELQAFALTFSASDPEGDALTFSMDAPPTGANMASNGTFTWTPAEDQDGLYEVTFRVTDEGGLGDAALMTLNVTEVNTAPELAPIANITVLETQPMSLTASATDPDLIAGAPQVLVFSNVTPLPSGATLDAATGELAWTPGSGDNGSYPVTLRVSDGQLTDDESFTIHVGDFNQPPEMDPLRDRSVRAGREICETFVASDPDGDPLTFNVTGGNGNVTQNGNEATWCWQTERSDAGVHTITVVVSDGSATATQSFDVRVRAGGGGGGGGGRVQPREVDATAGNDGPIRWIRDAGNKDLSFAQWSPGGVAAVSAVLPDLPPGFRAFDYAVLFSGEEGDVVQVHVDTNAVVLGNFTHLGALRLMDGSWVPAQAALAGIVWDGDQATVDIMLPCCGVFVLGQDDQSPLLNVWPGDGEGGSRTDWRIVDGRVIVAANASDNLRIDRLIIAVDGQEVLDEEWNGTERQVTIAAEPGDVVEVVAHDWMGLTASATATVLDADGEPQPTQEDGDGGGRSPFAWLAALLVLLVVGGLVGLLVWMRRRSEEEEWGG